MASSITMQRINIQTLLNQSDEEDKAAAARNKALLADAETAMALLKIVGDRAKAARAAEVHEEARIRQFEELAKLKAELEEVQARRDQAAADFKAELEAKDEAAEVQQQITAELELEKFDQVEREAVRVGVSAEVAAAAGAVDAGMAEAVRVAAFETRKAVAAQVSTQTRWLAEELPTLLEAQAAKAMRRLRMGEVGDVDVVDVTDIAGGGAVGGNGGGGGAADAAAEMTEIGTMTSPLRSPAAAAARSATGRSPVGRGGRLSSCTPTGTAAASGGSRDGSRSRRNSRDEEDPLAASTSSSGHPPTIDAAHTTLVGLAQAALKAAQSLQSAKGSDGHAVAQAQAQVLHAAASALEFAGKPLSAKDAAAAASNPISSPTGVAPAWHPSSAHAVPPASAAPQVPSAPPPWMMAFMQMMMQGPPGGQWQPGGMGGPNYPFAPSAAAIPRNDTDGSGGASAPGSAKHSRCASALGGHAGGDPLADANEMQAVAEVQAAALGLCSPAALGGWSGGPGGHGSSGSMGRRVSCIDHSNLHATGIPVCGLGVAGSQMAAMMDERRNSHDGGLPGRPAGATSLSGSLGRYSRDDDALAASIGSSDGGPTPAVRGDTSVAASKPSLSVGSKAKKGAQGFKKPQPQGNLMRRSSVTSPGSKVSAGPSLAPKGGDPLGKGQALSPPKGLSPVPSKEQLAAIGAPPTAPELTPSIYATSTCAPASESARQMQGVRPEDSYGSQRSASGEFQESGDVLAMSGDADMSEAPEPPPPAAEAEPIVRGSNPTPPALTRPWSAGSAGSNPHSHSASFDEQTASAAPPPPMPVSQGGSQGGSTTGSQAQLGRGLGGLRIDVPPPSAAPAFAASDAPACASRDMHVPSGSRHVVINADDGGPTAGAPSPAAEAALHPNSPVRKPMRDASRMDNPVVSRMQPTTRGAAIGGAASGRFPMASPSDSDSDMSPIKMDPPRRVVHEPAVAMAPPPAPPPKAPSPQAPSAATSARGSVHSGSGPQTPISPEEMAERSEGARKSFNTAAASLGYGYNKGQQNKPVSLYNTGAGGSAASKAYGGGGGAKQGGGKKTLSARIAKLGASDSEESDEGAPGPAPRASAQQPAKRGLCGFSPGGLGLADDDSGDSF